MTPSLTIDLARPWRTHPRETAGLGLLGLATAIALAGAAMSTARLPGPDAASAAKALPSSPAATDIRNVDAQTAEQLNAAIPFASGPNPAARPFNMAKSGAEMRDRALECLTSAIYYEAGQEPLQGQQAVAQVVLNRVRHPAFPASVCGVVYEGSTRSTGCQFTFTCDGSLARAPERSAWDRAREVARAALNGFVQPAVGNATHYHANYVAPYWAPTLNKTTSIGAHIFYRWSGGWGQPRAFSQTYSGRESDPKALRYAALSVPHNIVSPVAAAAPAMAKIDGVQVVQNDGKRVRVLFTPEARAAVEKVKHVDYIERVSASENLRDMLGGAAPAGTEKPLGRISEAAPGPATAATATAATGAPVPAN
jgi:spore germination cell wall hydrolase CwlJ-like protein